MAVVFTDLFTTGSNVNIEAYSPNYDIIFGDNNIVVNAGLGAVVSSTPNTDQGFRVQSGSGFLSNDYRVDIVTRYTQVGGFGGYCLVRADAAGAAYDFDCDNPTTGVYRVWKSTAGGNFTQVATFSGGPTPGLNTDIKLSARVTGTSPVVIDCYVNDIFVGTYTDANANRLQTGNPGVGLYSDGGTGVQVTSFTVDDLSGAFQGSTLRYWTGSAWGTGVLKRWDGASWVPGQIQRWNGSSWVNVP